MSAIHIMTSVKGGVGKTLISLGIALSYADLMQELLILDLNTMNPDLLRTLSYNGLSTYSENNNWQYATVNAKVHVFAPDDPYRLTCEADGFWDRVTQIADQHTYRSQDVLVDTNLHVANLVKGQNPLAAIERILEVPGRTIFIWILWTWAAFEDSKPITKALLELSKQFHERVSVVHVLNPSALIPPQIDLNSRMEISDVSQQLAELSAKLDQLLGPDVLQDTERIKARLRSRQEEELGRISSYKIPGLKQLAELPEVPAISYQEFRVIVEEEFKKVKEATKARQIELEKSMRPVERIPVGTVFVPLFERIRETHHGRPNNILAVSTHNPDLIGYTDSFASETPTNIDQIQWRISEIIVDIKKLLRNLNTAPFQKK